MKEERLMPNWERFSNFEVGSSGAIDTSDIKVVAFVGWNKNMGSVKADGLVYASNERVPSSGQINTTKGNSVTLEAVPLAGYHFVCWQGGPVDGSTNSQVTVTLNAPCTIKAVFTPDSVTVTPGSNGEPGNLNMTPADVTTNTNANTLYRFLGVYPKYGETYLKAFVRKYWWAIAIVAYIVWKKTKGGNA